MKAISFLHKIGICVFVFFILISCIRQKSSFSIQDIEDMGMNAIIGERLRAHIAYLSDDLFEGRGTGTRGMSLASKYMATQFRLLGIKPGGENGTYYQRVVLSKLKISGESKFSIISKTGSMELNLGTDVAFIQDYIGQRILKAPLVFVGYGIDCPETGWNDYDNFDADGMFLISLPGVPKDANFDNGLAGKYGSPQYKMKQAREKGALGICVLHSEEKPDDTWENIRRWTASSPIKLSEKYHKPGPLVAPSDTSIGIRMLRGFIRKNTLSKLFNTEGITFPDLLQQAKRKSFSPISLKAFVDFKIVMQSETIECRNTIGLIQGKKDDEYVIVSAHLDGLGIRGAVDGDSIYNGAVDNASGSAGLLEIGRAFLSLPDKPNRSVVLIATTAEELWLLGAKAYARNPIFPAHKTLAVVNLDECLPMKRRREVFQCVAEVSTLGELGKEIARDNGITLIDSYGPGSEAALFMSDLGGFAEAGIPGVILVDATKLELELDDEIKRNIKERERTRHTPMDEYSEDWEMGNLVEIVRWSFQFAYRITNAAKWPEWYEEFPDYYPKDPPFKKIREESLLKGSKYSTN